MNERRPLFHTDAPAREAGVTDATSTIWPVSRARVAAMPIRSRLAASVSSFLTWLSRRSISRSVSGLRSFGNFASTLSALEGHFTPSARTRRRSSSLNVAKKSRDLAADVERLSRTSFEVGAGTSFDLVDASRRLREAELTLAVRELDLVQAKIAALLASSNCTL